MPNKGPTANKPMHALLGALGVAMLFLASRWSRMRERLVAKARRRAERRGGADSPILMRAGIYHREVHAAHARAWKPRLARPWQLLFPPIKATILDEPYVLIENDIAPYYSVPDLAGHDPPKGPFDPVEDNAGEFVILTNRLGRDGLSYLMRPLQDLRLSEQERDDLLRKHFDMGYASLWVVRHHRTLSPEDPSRPAYWPPLPSPRHGIEGTPRRFIVLISPHYAKKPEPSTSDLLLDRFFNLPNAIDFAEDFTRRYRVTTCVGEIAEDRFWR